MECVGVKHEAREEKRRRREERRGGGRRVGRRPLSLIPRHIISHLQPLHHRMIRHLQIIPMLLLSRSIYYRNNTNNPTLVCPHCRLHLSA